jgi:predicted glycoside hydrolase/deacetylase ChbG (UPF0249 family)
MKKQLIINADDFGMNAFCDEAILELAKDNCITSTTILSNLCSTSSLKALGETNISTGLHINLIEGRPVSKPGSIKSLIDSHGNFKSAFHLFTGFITGMVWPEHIETEIQAQYKLLTDRGLQVSHADSHQHVHQYPYLGNCILKILKKLNIQKIRNCRVNDYWNGRMFTVRAFHAFVKNENATFTTPEILISTFSVQREASIAIFSQALRQAFDGSGTAEFMTHPATRNEANSYLNKKSEYDFWKEGHWKEWVDMHKIELISYNQL